MKYLNSIRLLFAPLLLLILIGCSEKKDQVSEPPPKTSPELYGNERGNGTDFKENNDGAAWFAIANKDIKWCLDVASDFGLPKDQVKSETLKALNIWKDYLVSKNITQALPFSTSFRYQTNCSSNTDLKLYFGTPPPSSIKFSPKRSVAFPVRQEYDSKIGWGKGLIWFTKRGAIDPKNAEIYGVDSNSTFPDWQKSNTLLGIILHELGHVFGIDNHVSETIMDADIFAHIDSNSEPYRMERLTQVDYNKELYICHECTMKKNGFLGQVPSYIDHLNGRRLKINEIANYKALTGKEPGSKLITYVEGFGNSNYVLVIADDQDEFRFPIAPQDSRSATKFHAEFIFSYIVDNMGSVKSHEIVSEYGILETDTNSYQVVINRNHASQSFIEFEIQILDAGTVRTLFTSATPHIKHVISLR